MDRRALDTGSGARFLGVELMKTYRIGVQRVEYHFQFVDVEAANEEEARSVAIEESEGWGWETCESAEEAALTAEEVRGTAS